MVFASLPDDILNLVLQFLDFDTKLIHLAFSSKKMFRFCFSSEKLVLDPNLSVMSTSSPSLSYGPEFFTFLSKCISYAGSEGYITELDIDLSLVHQMTSTWNTLMMFLKSLKSLKKITFRNAGITYDVSGKLFKQFATMTALQKICFLDTKKLDMFGKDIITIPNIKEFTLEGTYRCSRIDINLERIHFPNATHLCLNVLEFKSLPTLAPNIKYFSYRLGSKFVKFTYNSLEALELTFDTSKNDKILSNILEFIELNSSTLKSLRLIASSKVLLSKQSEKFIQKLPLIPNLEELSFSNIQITANDLENIKTLYPTLIHLSIVNSPDLTHDLLLNVIPSLPKICHLTIKDCSSFIGDEFLDELNKKYQSRLLAMKTLSFSTKAYSFAEGCIKHLFTIQSVKLLHSLFDEQENAPLLSNLIIKGVIGRNLQEEEAICTLFSHLRRNHNVNVKYMSHISTFIMKQHRENHQEAKQSKITDDKCLKPLGQKKNTGDHLVLCVYCEKQTKKSDINNHLQTHEEPSQRAGIGKRLLALWACPLGCNYIGFKFVDPIMEIDGSYTHNIYKDSQDPMVSLKKKQMQVMRQIAHETRQHSKQCSKYLIACPNCDQYIHKDQLQQHREATSCNKMPSRNKCLPVG